MEATEHNSAVTSQMKHKMINNLSLNCYLTHSASTAAAIQTPVQALLSSNRHIAAILLILIS